MSIVTTESMHLIAPWPGGITLECRIAGPAGAPVLMFLHGFPEGAFIWDELLAHFASRYRCVAPNLRGYAGSSAPQEVEAYRAKHLAADIAGLVQAVSPGAPLAALVAHDWGGAVAWGLAAQKPGLMQRLVMINSPHPATFLRELTHNPAQQQASAYMNFLCRPDAESLLAADDYARLWPFFENMGGKAWLDEELRRQYRAVWTRGVAEEASPGAGLRGPLNYYRASPLRPASEPEAALHKVVFAPEQVSVKLPTTVIWGEADTALPPSLLDGLEAYVPDLHVVRVPEATHWIVHERPQVVAREIEAALGR
ncbi:MAG TPA: alpha/beta fold hydrolase [Methylibium sp.]